MNELQFIVDANVLITAHDYYYSPQLLPAFWDMLAETSCIRSIDKVFDEIKSANWLSEWAKKNRQWFLRTDEQDVVDRYGEIIRWVNSRDYRMGRCSA